MEHHFKILLLQIVIFMSAGCIREPVGFSWKQINGPDPSKLTWAIDCERTKKCYEVAGYVCKAQPWRIIQASNSTDAHGSSFESTFANKGVAFGSAGSRVDSETTHTMLVQCGPFSPEKPKELGSPAGCEEWARRRMNECTVDSGCNVESIERIQSKLKECREVYEVKEMTDPWGR